MDNQVQNPQDDRQIQAGLPQKEMEPVIKKEPLVRASEEELRLHPEVAEAGVEAVAEKPKLSEGHLETGIKHAKESTPVKTEPSDRVSFPMSFQTANEIVKSKKNLKDSILWLATSVLRQIKIIGKGKN